MSVAIVDCGGANLRSVATSIERLQIPYVITDNSDEIIKAQYVTVSYTHLTLPTIYSV